MKPEDVDHIMESLSFVALSQACWARIRVRLEAALRTAESEAEARGYAKAAADLKHHELPQFVRWNGNHDVQEWAVQEWAVQCSCGTRIDADPDDDLRDVWMQHVLRALASQEKP